MLLRCVKALQYTQGCVGPALCAWMYRPPAAPLHPWEWPSEPWSRIHLDFACPYMGSMFLVLVNAHSKWMDAHLMHSITSAKTIEKLCIIFANHRIPRKVVTDNGPTFTSYEFQEFMQKNKIVHVNSAPYHLSSNGLAERAVQTLKRGIAQTSGTTLQERVSKFLFKYRLTPHSVTGVAPSELLFGRRIRCRLDRSQRVQKQTHDSTAPLRSFRVGDTVYAEIFHWIITKVVTRHYCQGYRTLILPCGIGVRAHCSWTCGLNSCETCKHSSEQVWQCQSVVLARHIHITCTSISSSCASIPPYPNQDFEGLWRDMAMDCDTTSLRGGMCGDCEL